MCCLGKWPVVIAAALMPALLAQATCARADEGGPCGVVANVKVVSDKVKDVSSLEAWKKSYLREGMSDGDKALAIWESVVAHQYQDTPPKEFLNNEGDVYDALKMFNVYGHSYCGVAACEIASLARYVGLKARVTTIVAHVVPEVQWDGQWHMLDASLVNFFVLKGQPADAVNGRFSRALTNYVVPNGKIASIEEIIAAVKQWYAKNPQYLRDDAKLRRLHAEGGWQGWRQGPAAFGRLPVLRRQRMAAGPHPRLVLHDAGIRREPLRPLRGRLFDGLQGKPPVAPRRAPDP